jgi:hypothetical protein
LKKALHSRLKTKHMTKCADCFNCKVVGTAFVTLGAYTYETPLVICNYFYYNKKAHYLYHIRSNKTYENCPYFMSMEDT